METILILTGILVAVAAGIAIGYFLGRRTVKDTENSCNKLIEEKEAAFRAAIQKEDENHREAMQRQEDSHRDALARQDEAHRDALARQDEAHREMLARQEALRKESLEAMQGRFDETIAKMQEQLKNVTSDMLRERQREFEESSKTNLGSVVEPLQQTIKQMKEAVADNTIKHTEMGGQLSANIANLMRHSDAARQSAEKLAAALRSGNGVQGQWGETVLTELLESQGLHEGVHFETQTTMRDEAGNILLNDNERRLRPDVILHLDRNRDVIIDAKVSLSAYMDYMGAETEAERTEALKRHTESIWKHVRELSAKNYSSYIRPPKTGMGYVIMFVPNTAALYAATNQKSDLWRKAMELNVYIADEQTLYAALKIIDLTWQQITQAENHERVYALADEMLKRVGMFMEKYVAIGKNLDSARKAYDEGLAKLGERGQSIPQTCGKLIALGGKAQPRKGVPDALLGIGIDTENDNLIEAGPEAGES